MTPLRLSLATIAGGIFVTSIVSHAVRTLGAVATLLPSVGTVVPRPCCSLRARF